MTDRAARQPRRPGRRRPGASSPRRSRQASFASVPAASSATGADTSDSWRCSANLRAMRWRSIFPSSASARWTARSASNNAAARPVSASRSGPGSTSFRARHAVSASCDEAGARRGRRPRRRRPPGTGFVFGPQRQRRGAQPGGAHLEDPLGLLDPRQQVGAEIAELDGGGRQIAGGLGHQDLPAVTGRADPRCPVHIDPDVGVADQLRLAGVKPHPHPQLGALRRQRQLRCDRRREAVGCAREAGQELVRAAVDLAARVRRDRVPQDLAVPVQRVLVSGTQLLDEQRRPFDVGEEECDGSAGKVLHRTITLVQAYSDRRCQRWLSQSRASRLLFDRWL